MLTAPDWALGSRYLRENAPELIPFIEKYGPCNLQPEAPEKYFGTLVTGIISQQLPPDVSLAMVKRLEETVGTPITPEAIASAAESDLCSCGIMPQKVMYLKGFAEAVLNGEVTMDKFAGMTDSEITKQLIKIKGLGQWTAEMFLLLALCRTDIATTADFIFQKRVKEIFNLNAMPKRKQLLELTEHWRPWRSLAVWYLWQEK